MWIGLGLVALSWTAVGLSVAAGVHVVVTWKPLVPVPPWWQRPLSAVGVGGVALGPPLGAVAGLGWAALLLRRHPERSPAAAAIAVGAALPLVAQIVAGMLLFG